MLMPNPRKRGRGQEEDEPLESGYDHKKPRNLPFRTSPITKHSSVFSEVPRLFSMPLLTPSATPVESSDDEQEPSYYSVSSAHVHKDVDLDIDMVDSQLQNPTPRWGDVTPREPKISAPRTSSFATFPNLSLQEQEERNGFSGGRIPTPRWGHFRSLDMSIDMFDAPRIAPSPSQSPPESVFNHSRRRRLPSPISEDENMIICPSLNTASPSGRTEQLMQNLDVRSNQASEVQCTDSFTRWAGPATCQGAVTPKFGKLMLSMGYRADCEKCRTRVPGHYNHFIRI